MLRIDDIPQQVADDIQRQAVDLFRTGDISLKNALHYGTIQLDKTEFDEGGQMMYYSIKSNEDIQYFYEKTNSLHDGYIIGVQYENNGISKTEHGHSFDFERTKLVLKILVTSILDAVVELEFDGLYEWQIKDNQWDMTDTTVMFDDHNRIVWSDDVYINMEEVKKGSYAIAMSMRWRIAE